MKREELTAAIPSSARAAAARGRPSPSTFLPVLSSRRGSIAVMLVGVVVVVHKYIYI